MVVDESLREVILQGIGRGNLGFLWEFYSISIAVAIKIPIAGNLYRLRYSLS